MTGNIIGEWPNQVFDYRWSRSKPQKVINSKVNYPIYLFKIEGRVVFNYEAVFEKKLR